MMKRFRVCLNIVLFIVRNPAWLLKRGNLSYLRPRKGKFSNNMWEDTWFHFDPNKQYSYGFKKTKEYNDRDFKDLILSAIDSFPPYTPLVVFEARDKNGSNINDELLAAYWPLLAGYGPWNIKYFMEVCESDFSITNRIPFDAASYWSKIKWAGHVKPGMPIPEVAI